MSDTNMTCAEFDELFPDWLEGDLEAERRVEADEHAASCARCQRLVRDVQGIRDDAAALPDLVPVRDLWDGIEERIQPSITAIRAPHRGTAISRRALAAAAAALVVASSGITYLATSRMQLSAPGVAVNSPTMRVAGATVEAESPERNEVAPAAADPLQSSAGVPSPVRRPVSALASRRAVPRASAAESAVASEIGELEALLSARRGELDPETVRVVEHNLAIVDAAVSQARAAVARDPGSGFLSERLESALQKKVQLLRTVALMRSST